MADNGYLSAGGADNVALVESKDSNACDVTKEHLIWNVDEAAKMQPRYAQSIFNFQYDCMHTAN